MRCFSRRDLLRLTATSISGASASGWLPALADETAGDPQRKRACILLWMNGGPSQIDTFDPKPGHTNGGPFKEIATTIPGVRLSEHLPKMAMRMSELAVIRSMRTKEGDHARATHLLRTGYLPQGPVNYPTIGSVLSKEMGKDQAELPNFVSISPLRALSPSAYGPGFLGPNHSPMVVGGSGLGIVTPGQNSYDQALKVKNLVLPNNVTRDEADARLSLLDEMERDFRAHHPGSSTASRQAAYQQAVRLMRSEAVKAFDLEDEPSKLRDAYGRNQFGQGCLLARRLVQRGVPFVEVSLNGAPGQPIFGWDTHINNFEITKRLSQMLDPAWATLIDDLRDHGLFDSTVLAWMGEFGRTPKINGSKGRDHFPAAWTTVLAGGGIHGGQVVGKTSVDGMSIEDRPISVPDLLSTVCSALGVDPMKQNMSNVGRPIRIVDPEAQPIEDILS